jgi:hypothetical protein
MEWNEVSCDKLLLSRDWRAGHTATVPSKYVELLMKGDYREKPNPSEPARLGGLGARSWDLVPMSVAAKIGGE